MMKQIKNIHVDERLIVNYLAGETSPAEAMAIDNWIQNPMNKVEYNRIVKTWNIMTAENAFEQTDINAAWDELQQSLNKIPVEHNINYKKLLYAAAAIVLIITTALIYTTHINKPQEQTTVFTQFKTSSLLLVKALPDKSLVTLNRNSSMKFNSDFKTNREIFLNGEAYFNVMPDKRKPFIIHEGELNIKVVGTKFNVKPDVENGLIKVQVQSGVVSMFTNRNEILVSKGKTGVYNRHEKKLTISDSLDENSLSYATKNFTFTNLSLEEVASYLEQAFNITVDFKNQEQKQCRLSARFQNEPLEYILHIISITLNINYTINNNIIVLDGPACN